MSKCREEFNKLTPEDLCNSPWFIYQAAWNARGKVDAEIAREFHTKLIRDDTVLVLARAIKQENEK